MGGANFYYPPSAPKLLLCNIVQIGFLKSRDMGTNNFYLFFGLQKSVLFLAGLGLFVLYSPLALLANPLKPIARPTVAAKANDMYFQLGFQKALTLSGVGALWAVSTSCKNVPIAVLDTGVDYNHVDLKNNIARDPKGKIIGYDMVNLDADPMDDHYHGTAVTGIIAAVGNNGAGVAGVCHDAKIIPVKVLNKDGAGSVLNVVRGVEFAIKSGAKILNNSYTTVVSINKTEVGVHPTIAAAYNLASTKGALVVVSAGNDSKNINQVNKSYLAPANSIYVAALDSATNAKAGFSNYGANLVNLSAPGTNMVSTYPKARYVGGLNGTSFAAPMVTGALALVWNGNLKTYSATGGHLALRNKFLASMPSDPYLSGISQSGRYLGMLPLRKAFFK